MGAVMGNQEYSCVRACRGDGVQRERGKREVQMAKRHVASRPGQRALLLGLAYAGLGLREELAHEVLVVALDLEAVDDLVERAAARRERARVTARVVAHVAVGVDGRLAHQYR